MHLWDSLPTSTSWWWEVNPARGSRKEGTQGGVAILRRRKKSPRLCISKLRSNEFYSTESWRIGDWTLRRDTPWNSWDASGTKQKETGQSGGIIQQGEFHEWNPCALRFLRNNIWSNLTKWKNAQCWARAIHGQIKWILGEDPANHMTVLTVTGKVQINEDAQVLFVILFWTSQCDYSMKRQRFYCFTYFAQNTDIHLSGKTAKLHDWPIMGNQLLVQWTTSYFFSYQNCHPSIPAAVCLQHRDQRIETWFQKIGTIVRSSHDSKWQACMRETDADRSWQAGHGKPWTSIRKKSRRDGQGKIQRKAFLICCSPSQLISRTWSYMCSHIPLKERTQIRKVMLQKWGYKNGSTVIHTDLHKIPKEICSTNRRDWWLENSRTQKRINSLPWYKISPFSGIRVKPKLHRGRRRIL